ncbi:hypothetical protein, partial [Acinetobacter baumannii]|uniref:hypothetical protein n=1 Tax=Acinetobacter baumannii TaxID=470 RepID=UPI001D0F393D
KLKATSVMEVVHFHSTKVFYGKTWGLVEPATERGEAGFCSGMGPSAINLHAAVCSSLGRGEK